jgi:hypothetical protein
MGLQVRALQKDPAIVDAVRRYGVILEWPLESSAPPESEFHGLPVRRASPCNAGWSEDPMEALRTPEDLYQMNPM